MARGIGRVLRSDGTIYETEEAAAKVYMPFGVTEEMFHYALTHGRPLGGRYFAYMDQDNGRNSATPRITDEEKARAVELYDSGVMLHDVAKALGCSKITKRNIMDWAGRPCEAACGEPCDGHVRGRINAVAARDRLSFTRVCEKAGLSRSCFTVTHANIRHSTLVKLMNIMPADVTAEWLLRGEGQPPAGIDFEPPEDG